MQNPHLQYVYRLADNALILGQRLSEWCGHGPVLEQDIAITNIALDQVGQARTLFLYAAELEGKGRTEDDLAYLRDAHQYFNLLLLEQPNQDWAQTMMRQLLFDAFNFYFYQDLLQSKDAQLSAIAEKALKEITYHLRFSSEWVIRLGDGTALSHDKMQEALNNLWMYTGELCTPDELDLAMLEQGIGVDLLAIKPRYEAKIQAVLKEATLQIPEGNWIQKGGKQGIHTEHLGFLLAEMQFLQRAYPGATW